MRISLDTHAFLWAIEDPKRLSAAVRAAIQDATNDVFVSAAVGWEIAIKAALGKIDLPRPVDSFVRSMIVESGFAELSIGMPHALAVAKLPLPHGDPFDRLLIAQAIVEDLTLATVDAKIVAYADRQPQFRTIS